MLGGIKVRKFYGNFIQDVDAFDHAFFSMISREALALDPQQRLLLETAFQLSSLAAISEHTIERTGTTSVFILVQAS